MINEEYRWPFGTICAYCRRVFDENHVIKTKDHIVPISRGGINDVKNYVCSCKDCNNLKGNFHILVFADLVYNMPDTHKMYEYSERIMFNCWKIYNKTYRTLMNKHRVK